MTTVKIHNAETGEVIVREANADDLADLENVKLFALEEKQMYKELANKKQALLEKLGITEEEARLLLS